MKQPGGTKRYAYWMIDPKWIDESEARFESLKYMIDLDAKAPPDVDSLEEKYGRIDRVYIEDLPTPIKPRPASGSSRYSRSISPSVSRSERSASPFVHSPVLPPNSLPFVPGHPCAQPGAPQQHIEFGKLRLNAWLTRTHAP